MALNLPPKGFNMPPKGLNKPPQDKPKVGPDYSGHLGEAPKNLIGSGSEPIHVKPMTGMVHSQLKKGLGGKYQDVNGPGESESVHPGFFLSKPNAIQVGIEGSRTVNLGDFNSVRIGVSITIPCDPELIGEAYEFGSEWISNRINEAINGAKALL